MGCSKCYLADEKVGTVVPGGQARSADGEWEGHRGYCRGGGSGGLETTAQLLPWQEDKAIKENVRLGIDTVTISHL